MRVTFTELIEAAGDDDCRQAAEHNHRQNATERHALVHMQQGGIADGERDRPFPNTARHDRQNDKEEDLEWLKAQRYPYAHANNHADNFAAQHREEDAQEALNQHGAVHAHDAADNNAADIEVENVGGFVELRGGLHHHIRQQTVIDQCRRNKGGANRRRAEFTDNRQALAKLTAGKAEERERGDHHHDIAGQFAAEAINGNQRAGQDKQWQRDNSDFPRIHNMPPALFE